MILKRSDVARKSAALLLVAMIYHDDDDFLGLGGAHILSHTLPKQAASYQKQVVGHNHL